MITSAEEFVRLRVSEVMEEYLRAANDSAPQEVWDDVILRFPDYTRWVAFNKTIPEELIRRLATFPDSEVRFTIAMKRKTPPDVLEILAKDPDLTVRQRISYNPKTPENILLILATDPEPLVHEQARKRLGRT